MIMIIMIILLKRILINVHVSTPNKNTVCNDVSLYYELVETMSCTIQLQQYSRVIRHVILLWLDVSLIYNRGR